MGFISKKAAAVVIVILILATIGALKFLRRNSSEIVYQTAQVDRNDILSKIMATGTINPITTLDIKAQVSGVIIQLYVDFNSQVKKDDQLAQIDPSLFENDLKLAESSYKKSQTDFNIADSVCKTDRELYRNSLISKDKLDVAQANLSSTLSAYQQSKAVLEIAKSNLKKTQIISPINGIVLARNVNVGESVTPGGPPLFVVADSLTKMKLEINVSEVHIGKVKKGEQVFFTVYAYPNKIFHGTVSQVLYDPVYTNNIVTYRVIALIDNENLMLKPGMTAEANIIVADEKNALRVPTAALRFIPLPSAKINEKPDQGSGGSYVWILQKDGRIAPVAVKRGVSDDMYTEIKEGDIREGQSVIVESSVSKKESKISNTYLPQPGRF